MQENLERPGHTPSFTPFLGGHITSSQFSFAYGQEKIERRRVRRYRVQGRLLSICKSYAGQILDISRCGLAFQIVHFLPHAGGKGKAHPRQSARLDILSPGLSGYFFRDLPVKTISDLNLGRLHPENDGIIAYRRSVQLLEPLGIDQLLLLERYLKGRIHETAPANYFS